MLERKISLYEKLFRILFSTNQGLYLASAMVTDRGVVSVSYEMPNCSHSSDKQLFFELDCNRKTVNFSLAPKSSLTERECTGLVADLKKAGYTIGGEFFLTPRFKPNKISLY
jgi:hypothetical protein